MNSCLRGISEHPWHGKTEWTFLLAKVNAKAKAKVNAKAKVDYFDSICRWAIISQPSVLFYSWKFQYEIYFEDSFFKTQGDWQRVTYTKKGFLIQWAADWSVSGPIHTMDKH